MVRALDCHSRGRGFEPRRSRCFADLWDVGAGGVSANTDAVLQVLYALVVELVDTLL